MTQEQIMRRMLEGFVNDPPDSDYQQGFLAASLVIANEIMGIEWDDPLILAANDLIGAGHPDVKEIVKKARSSLTVIDGGKSSLD
jgi:disulfide oxidoreductase YuzD